MKIFFDRNPTHKEIYIPTRISLIIKQKIYWTFLLSLSHKFILIVYVSVFLQKLKKIHFISWCKNLKIKDCKILQAVNSIINKYFVTFVLCSIATVVSLFILWSIFANIEEMARNKLIIFIKLRHYFIQVRVWQETTN